MCVLVMHPPDLTKIKMKYFQLCETFVRIDTQINQLQNEKKALANQLSNQKTLWLNMLHQHQQTPVAKTHDGKTHKN